MKHGRRVGIGALVLLLFIWWQWSRAPPSPGSPLKGPRRPRPTCTSLERTMGDVALWTERWQEVLQRGQHRLPADLSFASPELDRILSETGQRDIHMTSYHFWQGDAIRNWYDGCKTCHVSLLSRLLRRAAWLGQDEKQQLVAFVPSRAAARASRGLARVEMVDGFALIENYILCHRDPGSGIKVRAVLELLARGRNVHYSDADVVWFRPPSSAFKIRPETDLAIQVYGTPSRARVANGEFGLNFGLFFVRSNGRTKKLFRKLFRAMIRSLTVRKSDFGFDTCNDQNCLNQLLFQWEPELVCGWYFRGDYFEPSHRGRKASSSSCITLELLDPELYPTAQGFGFEQARERGAVALHMTGYWGGHTFAKIFALQEHGLWRVAHGSDGVGSGREDADSMQYLVLPPLSARDDLSRQMQYFMAGIALALLSRRTLVLPVIPCAGHPMRKGVSHCSVDEFFRIDLMLECNRALMGQIGYGGVPDVIQHCESCKIFLGTPLFVPSPSGPTEDAKDLNMEQLIKREGAQNRVARLAEHVTVYQVLLKLESGERKAVKQMLRMYFVPLDSITWPDDTFPMI